MPQTFCPLGVQRLKALRHAGRELTEEEESALPGCAYACSHQLSNYCFFNYIENYLPENRSLTDVEVAHMCSISVDTVKKTEKRALEKMRNIAGIQEILQEYNGEQILNDSGYDTNYSIVDP